MDYKVSIIVPVYNVEEYIEKCARSLFEQTFQDIEFIFIDDCSPDRSIDVVKKVLNDYPNRKEQVIFHKMPVNSGLPTVRKEGIMLAKGVYIIHCDSDDTIKPNMVEVMYNAAIDGDYDVVTCDIDWSNEYNPVFVQCKNKIDLIKATLTGRVIESVCTKLVKKEIYLRDDFIFTKDNVNEDCVFSIQIAFYCKSFKQLKERFYNYNMHEGSISHAVSEEKMLRNFEQFKRNVDLIEQFLERVKIKNIVKKELEIKKLTCKNYLTPITHIPQYKKLWRTIYPEISGIVLFNKLLPIRTRLVYYCVKFNLYFVLRPIFTKSND